MGSTLFEKLWQDHLVHTDLDGEDLVLIDRVMLHERTGAVALKALSEKGRPVKTPGAVYCTMDHIVSTRPERSRDDARTPGGGAFITATREAANAAGINLIDTDDPRQGIVHVIAPELGIIQPGMSLVCPDSHTCSLGAFGALAWGIGSSDAEHAMATGTLRLERPHTLRVKLTGTPRPGIGAKDIVLAIIARFGAGVAAGHAVEFSGPAVDAMDMESRLTLCNMAVEFAAFTALIAPDQTTACYLKDREFGLNGHTYDEAANWWRTLRSDEDAAFDKEIALDTSELAPHVSWGTSPEQSLPINEPIPRLAALPADKQAAAQKAAAYMGVAFDTPLKGMRIDGAFIGSCTNGRLSDLRLAAEILANRRVAPHVRAICVPGSQAVKRAAEAEGIADIFRSAGFEWGQPGCGNCFYAGGETFAPQSRVMSTTNRNFEGRQGPGVRTHICSPATVAASAIMGAIAAAEDVLCEEAVS